MHESFSVDPKELKNVVYTISERTFKAASARKAKKDSSNKTGTFRNSFQSCTSTNITSNRPTILLDSGFSGCLVIGEECLRENYQKDIIRERSLQFSSAPSIVFSSGKPQRSLKLVTLRNIGDCLVVEGRLALIAGREWLKMKRAIMDFGSNTVKLQGISGVSTPSHELQPGLLGASCGQVETCNQEQAFAAVASIPAQGAQRPSDGVAEVCCCDELRFGYNLHVYCTSGAVSEADVDDKQIEEAVLDGWIAGRSEVTRPEAEERSAEVESGRTLKRSNLDHRVLSWRDAEELEKLGGNKNKIFNITVSQLRKLHLLRHSPTDQIMKFLYECVPKFLSAHPLVLNFFFP